MYYDYDYRETWQSVLNAVRRSLFAEEMVCSISTELYHIPQTRDLKGNNEMHRHLVPASYHRVTAAGSALRLATGEQRQSIIDTLTGCINNAEREDRSVKEWLPVMEEDADRAFKPVIRLVMRWQNQAELYLSQAKSSLAEMGIAFPANTGEESGGSGY
ncbi:hypothetical protein EWH99_13275 [Sporolactobacillus sp. THM7-7]|nr:hypothetical protein EWH99_13275 [Sporolactobacillus sp. THM7-7]